MRRGERGWRFDGFWVYSPRQRTAADSAGRRLCADAIISSFASSVQGTLTIESSSATLATPLRGRGETTLATTPSTQRSAAAEVPIDVEEGHLKLKRLAQGHGPASVPHPASELPLEKAGKETTGHGLSGDVSVSPAQRIPQPAGPSELDASVATLVPGILLDPMKSLRSLAFLGASRTPPWA